MNPKPLATRRRGRPPARFRRFRQRHPETAFWLTAGLVPRAALALARAGILSLADLEARTSKELLAIPGVGAASVDLLAELLGRPRPGARPFPEDRWRQRGIPPEAAVTFVQVGMTRERLRVITREELLALPRVGPATVRACELLLGRPIPSARPADPGAAFWKSRGIPAGAARSLSRAGLASPEDLARCSREDLLSLPEVRGAVLRRLEIILGTGIPGRTEYWLRHGLSLYVAQALFRVKINTREELESMTRSRFLALPGLGLYVLAQCEKLLGRKLP